ncbi:DoxX family protein [Chthoniobacter flavus Ellin428]|uniref:DoxX family protein n=1 Tax=Chthoniobacter flavus Ellin428 TaxID=497964 RepID=B4D8D9_9BACT|nr:hypothetical protein [Chthoniobacter flavus]EDY17332.1 DoxX family protein [Chthoniobacter flavus Ellin428]TCO90099.1 hypothetical protein EV701_11123 [Chthoniobacter flavus]
MNSNPFLRVAIWLLRLALAAAFFSAVADRFGLWGAPGAHGVSWGDWPHFLAYTSKLLWFLPPALVNVGAWAATIAEVVLGIALLTGRWSHIVALATVALLTSFGLTMTVALGVKAPLDYSVFTATAAALLLAAITMPRR